MGRSAVLRLGTGLPWWCWTTVWSGVSLSAVGVMTSYFSLSSNFPLPMKVGKQFKKEINICWQRFALGELLQAILNTGRAWAVGPYLVCAACVGAI